MIGVILVEYDLQITLQPNQAAVFSFWPREDGGLEDCRWGLDVKWSEDDGEVTADEGAMTPGEVMKEVMFVIESGCTEIYFTTFEFERTFKSMLDEEGLKYNLKYNIDV